MRKSEDKLANSYHGGGVILLNKGFTLVELLAVIVLLAIVALIATPVIDNVIDSSRQRANERSIEGYANAVANEYYNQQTGGGIPVIDSDFLANVDTQGNEINCENVLYSDDYQVVLNNCTIDDEVEQQYCYADGKHYECNDNEFLNILQASTPHDYVDNSGANAPELATNMIPIKYDGTNWLYADTTQEWYNYDNKEWANAVVLNNGVTKNIGDTISEDEIALWYVWIPRYKYQLFNTNNESVSEQLINIEFESGTASTGSVSCTDAINETDADGNLISETCTNAENGNWYTHPAFTFGNEELTGFWVGKFEISGTTDEITIKPNVSSLRSQTTSAFFTAIQNISTTYSLNGDSHMIKNMEWGAVAYLSHSNYGIGEEIYINNSSEYYTGRSGGGVGGSNLTEAEQYPSESSSNNLYSTNGYYTYDGKIVNYDGSIGDYANDRSLGTKVSTTGNIYGVYDISGGSWERVMGNMVDSSGSFYSSEAEFESAPEDKYYDKYTNDTSNNTHSRGKLGDATKETLSTFGSETGGWYSDYAYFVDSSYPWFDRGGYYNLSFGAGAFRFGRSNGNAGSSSSTHAILTF